jgi:DNA-binding transcriptional LysR family regulator
MRKNLDNGVLHAMSAFVRVVDAGSFTAAGSQMGLTTAQMSRLVSDLENRLETKLLQRTTRRLALTTAGERYIEQARSILELVAEAEGNASGASVEPSGRLRVQCMTNFGGRYILPLVAKYCARYPRVTIEYSTSQYFPQLLADGVDVSIYLAQQRLPDSGMVAQRLGTTFGLLCAAPEYLAKYGTPEHPRELEDHACLRLVNPSMNSLWDLSDGQSVSTPEVRGPVIADNPEVVLHGAVSGLGITMLPTYTVIDALRDGRLVPVMPQWRSPEIGVFLLLPTRRFLDAKTREWINLVKQELSIALDQDAAFFAQSG